MNLKYLPLIAILCVTACTQEPAPIRYLGNVFYGHEHEAAIDSPDNQTYPADSDRYKQGYVRDVEAAPAPAVGVSDLPPPGGQPAPAIAAAPLAAVAAPHFIWPVTGGRIISHFGPKPDGKTNDGINIAIAEGEPVLASADGEVVYAGSELKDYGNMIILRHSGGWMSAYAHLRELSVAKGARVKQNDRVGYVGMSGGVNAPQLHFALRNGKTAVDPEQYLPHTVAGMQ